MILEAFKKREKDGKLCNYYSVKCDICNEIYDASKRNYENRNARAILYDCFYCKNCNGLKEATGKLPYKNSPMHNSFAGAKQRCNYKNHIGYANYGGRGIKFMWDNYDKFFEDMHSTWFIGATIERIDSDGNYEKDNCKWATRKEQGRNKRCNIHTENDVTRIRELYESGTNTQVELAIMFNDSQGNISNIITRRKWQ